MTLQVINTNAQRVEPDAPAHIHTQHAIIHTEDEREGDTA